MIITRSSCRSKRIEGCHEGSGVLWCTELLADYGKIGAGFKFIQDDYLEPGASVGEHRHDRDEEIYVILSGRGVMKIDGVDHAVAEGDICLTRLGHSHNLTNGMESPMHFLVIGVNV